MVDLGRFLDRLAAEERGKTRRAIQQGLYERAPKLGSFGGPSSGSSDSMEVADGPPKGRLRCVECGRERGAYGYCPTCGCDPPTAKQLREAENG